MSIATVIFLFFAYMGATLAMVLTNPAYGVTLSARAAEWGRGHGLGAVVTWIEQEVTRLNPARTGGQPPLSSFGTGPTRLVIPAAGHLPAPVRLVSPAGPPLKDEGVWHVAGRTTTKGIPTVYVAFVRPDTQHTSYVAGVAWMDPTVLKAQLYSGSHIPGPNYQYRYTAPITWKASKNLVAVFNAGFRMQDANAGYYTDGHIIQPYSLRNGAASVVIFKDGRITVGKWGRDATMAKDVASVRQNLNLIVDNSKLVSGLNSNDTSQWGVTLGGTAYVWRSGLGVTKNGALVYIAGDALSIKTLANLFVLAGCKRAMELDINKDWVQYSTYKAPLGQAVSGGQGTSLLSTMIGPPSRYFTNWWARDFFSMSLR